MSSCFDDGHDQNELASAHALLAIPPPTHTFFAQSNAHPHSLRTIHHMFELHPVHHTHELLAIPLIHTLSDSSWLVVRGVIRIVGTRFFLSDHFNYLRTFLQI